MFKTVYFILGFFTIYFITLNHCNSIYTLQQNDIANNFSEAIASIVRIYFHQKQKRINFNFQVKVKYLKNKQFFEDIVEQTGKLLVNDVAVTLRTKGPIPETDDMHYSILLADSLEAVEYLFFNIIKYELPIYGSFYIVLHSLCSNWHYYKDMSAIIDLSWTSGVSHVDILVYGVTNVILLYHGIPFSRFHCHQNLAEIHNKFSNGRWQHKKFYVSKASNIHGCPLVCSTWEDMPYFQINPRSTSEKPTYLGLEGRLLEYLVQRMNFKLSFHWMTNDDVNRTIYDRDGLLKEIFSKGTDFTLGSFHYKTTQREDPYTPTVSYYPSTYYFVVSSKTDPYKPFEKLLLPFGLDVWGALILLCLGANIIIYAFNHMSHQWKLLILGRHNNSPYYNLMVVLFGGPVVKDPKVSFSRFLLMMWLYNMFIVRTVYQSLIYHVLKQDLHKPAPKTIDELKSGYQILMTEMVYGDISNISWLRDNTQFLNKTELESFDMFKDPSVYRPMKYSILTAYEYFGYYAHKSFGVKNFHLVPQVLYTQQLSIYMRKNSVYLNRFNIYIENFVNEGLMNRWERVLLYNDLHHRRRTNEVAKPMKLRELYGALNLLCIGLCVAVLVFIGELLYERYIRRFKIKSKRKRTKRAVLFDYID